MEKLIDTVKNLPSRRSPGPDGIPYEWYQKFLPQFATTFSPFSIQSKMALSLPHPPGHVYTSLCCQNQVENMLSLQTGALLHLATPMLRYIRGSGQIVSLKSCLLFCIMINLVLFVDDMPLTPL
jgi:hypothetical protein